MNGSEGQKPKCSEHTGWGEMTPGWRQGARGEATKQHVGDTAGLQEPEWEPQLDFVTQPLLVLLVPYPKMVAVCVSFVLW